LALVIHALPLEVVATIKKWWFLLKDDKPLLKKMVVRKLTSKKMVVGLPALQKGS